MNRVRTTRKIARKMPRHLKALRGQMMLSAFARVMGVAEVGCPACEASGWLCPERLETCPICCGFREVPVALSYWFQGRALHEASARSLGREAALPESRRGGLPNLPADSAPRLRHPPDRAYGRIAEVTFKLPLPDPV
jgi:hypothetical protein